jgi:hypothetical protein
MIVLQLNVPDDYAVTGDLGVRDFGRRDLPRDDLLGRDRSALDCVSLPSVVEAEHNRQYDGDQLSASDQLGHQ